MSSDTKISKFLSLILRHKPESIGLKLDASGWADIGELILKARKAGVDLTPGKIASVVSISDKRRFILNNDGSRIRANQGHSISIDLGLPEQEPPEFLFHGTAKHSLSSIKQKGIVPMNREFVHLSKDRETALAVGKRHGSPIVLVVQTAKMHRDGFTFYLSENGVWLTEYVPTTYLEA